MVVGCAVALILQGDTGSSPPAPSPPGAAWLLHYWWSTPTSLNRYVQRHSVDAGDAIQKRSREGVIIAAYAIRAHHAFVYVPRGEVAGIAPAAQRGGRGPCRWLPRPQHRSSDSTWS